ncbi:MAG TPA: phage holin family protein, partial [Ilumatobacteraceae bacterium]
MTRRDRASERPSWQRVAWRSVVVTTVTASALWLLAAIIPGFDIDSFWHALIAGGVVGLVNAVLWPALAFLVVPISVLTLGFGAIVLNGLITFWVLDLLPGVEIDGFWSALWV